MVLIIVVVVVVVDIDIDIDIVIGFRHIIDVAGITSVQFSAAIEPCSDLAIVGIIGIVGSKEGLERELHVPAVRHEQLARELALDVRDRRHLGHLLLLRRHVDGGGTTDTHDQE